MNERKYYTLLKKADFLMKLKCRIPDYVLQGSPVHDCTAREYDNLVRRNEKNSRKRFKYESIIADILVLIKQSGYSIDEILDKYDYWDIKGVLKCNRELLEYYEKRVDKHIK